MLHNLEISLNFLTFSDFNFFFKEFARYSRVASLGVNDDNFPEFSWMSYAVIMNFPYRFELLFEIVWES